MIYQNMDNTSRIQATMKWFSSSTHIHGVHNAHDTWQLYTYISLGNVSGLDERSLLHCDADAAENGK